MVHTEGKSLEGKERKIRSKTNKLMPLKIVTVKLQVPFSEVNVQVKERTYHIPNRMEGNFSAYFIIRNIYIFFKKWLLLNDKKVVMIMTIMTIIITTIIIITITILQFFFRF
jgi:hypothetical protein